MNIPQIFHKPAPADGMKFSLSNSGALSLTTGKVRLECPICGISFLKPAAWAKRSKVNYCGRGCADESKRRPTPFTCVICAKVFIGIPSEVGKIVTCSSECRSIDRRAKLGNQAPKAHADRSTGNGKLSNDQVAQIASSPETTCLLSAHYGVSPTLIRNIRRKARTGASLPTTSKE